MQVNREVAVDFVVMAGLVLGTMGVTQGLFLSVQNFVRDEPAQKVDDSDPLARPLPLAIDVSLHTEIAP